jgi:hypothetical protein
MLFEHSLLLPADMSERREVMMTMNAPSPRRSMSNEQKLDTSAYHETELAAGLVGTGKRACQWRRLGERECGRDRI